MTTNSPGRNNPYNLVCSTIHWNGEIRPPKGRFCDFIDLPHGIRAGMMDFRARQTKHGLHSPLQIIGDETWGWAPASDHNDPQGYASFLADGLGVKPTDAVNLSDPDVLVKAMERVGWMESHFTAPAGLLLQIAKTILGLE